MRSRVRRVCDLLSTGELKSDVIVVGGGASGVTAALQAARMGAKVLLVEAGPWLGGMLTSAGISALDGNDAILSGIHGEFVHAVREEYGGTEAVATGWVSNTLFEPKTGQRILRCLIEAEPNITLWLETSVTEVLREEMNLGGVRTDDGRVVRAPVLIDATECGDVIAMAGVVHRFGRESRDQTGEFTAPDEPDEIIQDMTLCLTVRDFGPGADRTIPEPPGYDPAFYEGSVREVTSDPERFPFKVHPWKAMIDYGRLPGGRIMLNWPHRGNDFFAPEYIAQTPEERAATVEKMKNHALGFLHYLQTACGHPEIGLDEEAYPTSDGLPLIPYVREGRRIEATVMLHLDDVTDRYSDLNRPLFMTGIAVGDYFIDHHHHSRLNTGKVDDLCNDRRFPQIQAVTVPLGCLIPIATDGLITAEKSIGVTHAVNGVTRLQPIVMNIGQAAGALAALAAAQGFQPRDVNPRDVQQALLDAGCLLMPFADVGLDHPRFQPIHRVAVAGVMRGFDEPRRCEFRPDAPMTPEETGEIFTSLLAAGLDVGEVQRKIPVGETLTRGQFAEMIDCTVAPFRRLPLRLPTSS